MAKRETFQPDFICIGAQRSGTTWLDKMLRAHPEVRLPVYKEVNFFNDYIHFEALSKPIESYFPEVKLIALLRQPVERSYSNYLFYRDVLLLDDSATPGEAFQRYPAYMQRSRYAFHLKRYLDHFQASSSTCRPESAEHAQGTRLR